MRPSAPVFVVGAPRSGTTFMGNSLGRLPGFVDLRRGRAAQGRDRRARGAPGGGVGPALPANPRARAPTGPGPPPPRGRADPGDELRARRRAAARTHRARRYTWFATGATSSARSSRRVGSGGARRSGRRGSPYGEHARSWVEPERVPEFQAASEATRAAWAWRRYLTAARAGAPEATIEVRYEDAGRRPGRGPPPGSPSTSASTRPSWRSHFATSIPESVGRWRRDLTDEQVADVEAQAGPLLRELGYS